MGKPRSPRAGNRATGRPTAAESRRAQARTTQEREQKFVEGLQLGLGKREAAIRAGYSPRSAGPIATELLERPTVRKLMEAYYKRDEPEVRTTRELLRRRLLELALTDAASEVLDEGYNLRPKSEISPAALRMIQTARTWDTEEQGSGSSVKLVHPIDPIKWYLKLFPAPPPTAQSLQDAADEVEQEILLLLDRIEEEEEDVEEEDDTNGGHS